MARFDFTLQNGDITEPMLLGFINLRILRGNATLLYFNVLLTWLQLHCNNNKKIATGGLSWTFRFIFLDVSFWRIYKWSKDRNNSMYRIGFVGYELCYDGTLRVRRSSLIKEKQKIKKLINGTLQSLKKGKRKSDNTIIESISNKLIGMSVGRVSMRNYRKIDNDMCWANGFTCLNSNESLKVQLKRLDRHRAKYLSRFKRKLQQMSPANTAQRRPKYIGKYFFSRIYSVQDENSIAVRQELVNNSILSPKFFIPFAKREKLRDKSLTLLFSKEYAHLEQEVLECLLNDTAEERMVPIYGKPFSYYYNIIEKKAN